ncbi:MAG: hypothetical protein WDM94_14300 [Bauldia sp.]
MSVNAFRPKKFEDFEIVDASSKVVGHLRVKPSGILWGQKGGKKWFGVTLKQFAEFAEAKGKAQGK